PRPYQYTLLPYTTLFRSRCQDVKESRRVFIAHLWWPRGWLPPAMLFNGRKDPRICQAARSNDTRQCPLSHSRSRPHLKSIAGGRSEEHTSELQSRENLVC